jgi:hypothetical protein
MNDEQNSASSEQANTQNSSANPGGTQPQTQGQVNAQEQISEFMASARAASENARASENDAKNVISRLNKVLADANAALDKISESTPKFAAAATEMELRRTTVAAAATDVEAKLTAIATAASEVEVKRAAVAAHTQQIDGDQKRATELRGELESLLVNAKQTQAETDGLKQGVESAKSSATQAIAEIQAAKASVDQNAKDVTSVLAASNSAFTKTKAIADKADTIEQRVKDYEAKLVEISAQCEAQLEAIKSLLPGATSAGLASAFDQRRTTFLKPSKRWQWLFVGSVVVLAVLALASLIEAYLHAPELTYQQLLVRWISRIPFAASLVWLAMHASRESALAKRLEEDYGFKASVASSFQGFQEQMKIVGGSVAGNEPLKALCDATLAQITNPPGRIYEKHALIVSPTTELLKAAQMVLDAAKAGKLPAGS